MYHITSLPTSRLGSVGDEIEAVILYYYPESNKVIMAMDNPGVERALLQMAGNIRRYVATAKDQYIPKEDELCIAKYGNDFYRALCIESEATDSSSLLYFLDYGNTQSIYHKNIRVFTKEFTRLAPYGVVCDLSSMLPQHEQNLQQVSIKLTKRIGKFMAQVLLQSISIKIVDIQKGPYERDGTLLIDIPRIRDALVQEGLIPSNEG